MLVDGQRFRARAQERTAAARDRVQRVAASQDAQLAKHRAAVRDQPAPASPVRPVRNPPRRSPPDVDDLPDGWLW